MSERVLVCMRLDDMRKVHPDQIERACSNCGQTVGVYPSGQQALKTYPTMPIICVVCADKDRKPGDVAELAGSWEQIALENAESRKT